MSVTYIQCSDDAHVAQDQPNTHFGYEPWLDLRTWPGSPDFRNVWWKFYLSIGAGDIIDNAMFNFLVFCTEHWANYSGRGAILKRCTSDNWSTGSITWNNAPNTYVLPHILAEFPEFQFGEFLQVDVTADVIAEIADNNIISFRMEIDAEYDTSVDVHIAAKDYTGPRDNLAAYLAITHHAPGYGHKIHGVTPSKVSGVTPVRIYGA